MYLQNIQHISFEFLSYFYVQKEIYQSWGNDFVFSLCMLGKVNLWSKLLTIQGWIEYLASNTNTYTGIFISRHLRCNQQTFLHQFMFRQTFLCCFFIGDSFSQSYILPFIQFLSLLLRDIFSIPNAIFLIQIVFSQVCVVQAINIEYLCYLYIERLLVQKQSVFGMLCTFSGQQDYGAICCGYLSCVHVCFGFLKLLAYIFLKLGHHDRIFLWDVVYFVLVIKLRGYMLWVTKLCTYMLWVQKLLTYICVLGYQIAGLFVMIVMVILTIDNFQGVWIICIWYVFQFSQLLQQFSEFNCDQVILCYFYLLCCGFFRLSVLQKIKSCMGHSQRIR
eukprot:TRINITY_DN5225_c0_g1_i11.p2 TRINITY_DN5225_c0_g1~~TRINITY_DN5225_c0_g1_i11.p2  ORF type:complete len:333 (-),score=-33.03 TRINITY_DN5225_c0_g1_i11:1083-2081(-)